MIMTTRSIILVSHHEKPKLRNLLLTIPSTPQPFHYGQGWSSRRERMPWLGEGYLLRALSLHLYNSNQICKLQLDLDGHPCKVEVATLTAGLMKDMGTPKIQSNYPAGSEHQFEVQDLARRAQTMYRTVPEYCWTWLGFNGCTENKDRKQVAEFFERSGPEGICFEINLFLSFVAFRGDPEENKERKVLCQLQTLSNTRAPSKGTRRGSVNSRGGGVKEGNIKKRLGSRRKGKLHERGGASGFVDSWLDFIS